MPLLHSLLINAALAPSRSFASRWLPKKSDVVIVGGGVIGCSVAYWLKQLNPQGISVTVLERDPCYTQASTVLSVGGIRQQFSQVENVQLSLYSFDFLMKIKHHLSVLEEDPPTVNLNRRPYLILASEEGSEQLEKNHSIQVGLGAKVKLLTSRQVKQAFPWINTKDIKLASCGVDNEGWFDPWLLLKAFKSKAKSLGAHFVHGETIGFDVSVNENSSREVKGVHVRNDSGKEALIEPGKCVNCAGAHAGQVAKLAGIGAKSAKGTLAVPLPVEPRKRYVYVVHAPKGPTAKNTPLLIDKTGVYARPESDKHLYLCGKSPQEAQEPDTGDLHVDYDYFNEVVWPTLAERAPCFESIKVKAAWAGYYDYNTLDQNMIVGQHPDFTNLLFCNGFSGHGIQQAAAVGRSIMELITEGKFSTIDLSAYGFQRIIDNKPLPEKNII